MRVANPKVNVVKVVLIDALSKIALPLQLSVDTCRAFSLLQHLPLLLQSHLCSETDWLDNWDRAVGLISFVPIVMVLSQMFIAEVSLIRHAVGRCILER